jgi:hypothetical protein
MLPRVDLPEVILEVMSWAPEAAALSGGARYSPTTSRILASSSGSVLNLHVSIRCGWRCHLRQIRATDANEIPAPWPLSGADQWVIPSRLGGRPSLTSVATTTLISSISAGRPDRGWSSRAAVPPADHGRPRHPDRPGDLRVRNPVRGQQHHPRPLGQPGRHARQPRQIRRPVPVTLTQHKSRS